MRRVTIVLLGLAVLMPLLALAAAEVGTTSGVAVLQIATPSLPFVVLAVISQMRPALDRMVVGAAAGAVLGLLVPFGMAWYSQQIVRPLDADIGTGIVLLATPLLVLLGMAAGWGAGWLTRRSA